MEGTRREPILEVNLFIGFLKDFLILSIDKITGFYRDGCRFC